MARGTGALSTMAPAGAPSRALVSATDVRRVMLLVREGGEIHDRGEQQAHLLAGLSAIVGADVAVGFDFDLALSPRPTAGFVHGLSPGETQRMFTAYMGGGDGFD